MQPCPCPHHIEVGMENAFDERRHDFRLGAAHVHTAEQEKLILDAPPCHELILSSPRRVVDLAAKS